MKGYLIQLLDEYNDPIGLYWSAKKVTESKISKTYSEFQESFLHTEEEFEDFWNNKYQNKIERVFVDEIYV